VGVKAKRSLALFICLLIAASISAFALTVALADEGYKFDEDDSPGPFDIERFGYFHGEGFDRLTLDFYEDLDPTLLDEQLDWVGFILEDDIVNDGYVNAVFVTFSDDELQAGLYSAGQGGPEPDRFVRPLEVQMTDANSLEVYLEPHQYAWFHHWFGQSSFETIGNDDRGFPDCNWATPPPRPYPPKAKCFDQTNSVPPYEEASPMPTEETPSSSPDPPCAFKQSQCRENYITIHRGAHSFYGVVHNRRDRCVGGRKVILRTGFKVVVGKDMTNDEGKWRIPLEEANGSYYALATEFGVANSSGWSTTCHRMRSIDLEV
jgi:hypothetical protein